jgi:hypothetical protein
LFTDQSGLPHVGVGLPFPEEELAQERVQGLLFRAQFLTARAVLLVEGAEEPLQDC